MSFRFKKFDLSTLNPHSSILIIGKRYTGKITLVNDIIHHSNIPAGIALSSVPGRIKSKTSKVLEYDDCKSIYDLQKCIIKRQKLANNKYREDKSFDPRTFVIFNQCFDDNIFRKSEYIKTIFFNNRNYNILFITVVQYPLLMPPAIRSNIDYVFIFRDNYIQNQKKIYKYYADMIPSFELFSRFFEHCNNDYE